MARPSQALFATDLTESVRSERQYTQLGWSAPTLAVIQAAGISSRWYIT
jgi:hypothetical protein